MKRIYTQTSKRERRRISGAYKLLCTGVLVFISLFTMGQLNGSYTIDGFSVASNTNYVNLTNAVSDMLSGTRTDGGTPNGPAINGAVIFGLANGTYTEQVEITAIAGASVSNTVTFKSVANDSTAATIQFNASVANNYVFRLNGARYIRFDQLHIYNSSAFVNTAIEILGGASNISISNCFIEGSNTSFGSPGYSLLRSLGDADNDISITNNRFLEGGNAVYLDGAIGNFETGLVINDNIMDGQASKGVYLSHQNGFSINNNRFINGGAAIGGITIVVDSSSGANSINYNEIIGGQSIGVKLENVVSSQGGHTLIYNNSISNTSTVLGQSSIWLESVDYIDLAHNSTYAYATGIQVANGLNIRAGSSNVTANNNVFYVVSGYAIYDQSGSALVQSDRNDIYAETGTKLAYSGGALNTLALWQAGTGLDANSISEDPMYVYFSDLHLVAGSPCIGIGLPIAGIATDLDGETRSATPDLGADEHSCVGAPPTSGFSFSSVDLDVLFVDNSTGAGGWSWDFGDLNTSTLQDPDHTYGASGTYLVCLSVFNVCGTETFCDSVTVMSIGISEILLNEQFNLYPNPTSDQINITNSTQVEIEMYSVTDLTGRVVQEGQFQNGSIDVRSLSSGYYIVSLVLKDARMVVKPIEIR